MDGRAYGPSLAAVIVAALLLCGAAGAQESDRSGISGHMGIGVGRFYRYDPDAAGREVSRFALGFESKVSANLGPYVSVFVLSAVSINEIEAGVNFARWVGQDDEWTAARILLGLFIPFAFLGDSHGMVGPGVSVRFRAQNPAPYAEVGAGLSSVISVADRSYLFGSGFFGGVGVDITDRIGAGVRAVWTPARLDSGWTSSSPTSALTVLGMVHFGGVSLFSRR
jgi:hypothetical protein